MPQWIKSVTNGIFPDTMPIEAQFQAARNAGFEGIEIRLGRGLAIDASPEQAKRILDASRQHRCAIVSLWVSNQLAATPLNHHDPAVRSQGVDAIRRAIDLCKMVNCGAILIVPGRLGSGATFRYGYQESWDRISTELRKVIRHAEESKVYLTPENVSNKFLVSPLEMRAFLDQFQSPWVQAHFDTGNVMPFGYPQDWIETLGTRIKRVHVKDHKLNARGGPGQMVDLMEGDVDWPAVMTALKKAGYQGFLSPEYAARDNEYLLKISRSLDKILALA